MVINKPQAKIVRFIFAEILSGKGTHKIANELNRRKVPTGYRKYKPPFCSSSEVSYLKFPHSFTAQAPILTAGPA